MSGKEAKRRERAGRLVDILGNLPDDILEEAARTESRQDFEKLAAPERAHRNAGCPTAKEETAHHAGQSTAYKLFGRFTPQARLRLGMCAACLSLLLVSLAVWRLRPGAGAGSIDSLFPGMSEGGSLPGNGADAGGAGQEADGDGAGGEPVTTAAGVHETAAGVRETEAGMHETEAGQETQSAHGTQAAGETQAKDGGESADGSNPVDVNREERGFWYGSRRYTETKEAPQPALPAGYEPAGVLCLAGRETGADWGTWSEELAGCQVYVKTGASSGAEQAEAGTLFVEEEDGYHAYRPAGKQPEKAAEE